MDASAAIANDTVTAKLKEKAWHLAMNALLQDRTPDFLALSDAFDNKQLLDLCGKVYEFMMSLDHPQAWLDRSIQ